MWLIHAAFIHFKWIAPKFSWLPECSCMLTVSALGISITSLVANHNQLKVHLNGPPKHLSSNAKQNLRFTKDSFSSIASEHNNWFSVRYDQNLPIPLPYTESWDMRENKSCSFSCHLVLRNLKHFHFKKGSEKTKKSVFIRITLKARTPANRVEQLCKQLDWRVGRHVFSLPPPWRHGAWRSLRYSLF